MPYTPPSIRENLPKHIDSGVDSQNGQGWEMFQLCMKVKLSATAIGKLFNKHRKTAAGWMKIYEEKYNVEGK